MQQRRTPLLSIHMHLFRTPRGLHEAERRLHLQVICRSCLLSLSLERRLSFLPSFSSPAPSTVRTSLECESECREFVCANVTRECHSQQHGERHAVSLVASLCFRLALSSRALAFQATSAGRVECHTRLKGIDSELKNRTL